MPNFNSQYLDLALAGDVDGFNEAMYDDWRLNGGSMLQLAGSIVENVSQGVFTSSTSHTIVSSGTLVFGTNQTVFNWPAGTPVLISENGAPSTRYMFGNLSAASVGVASMSITITGAVGAGSYAGWTIQKLQIAPAASPAVPVSVANGAFGVDGTTAGGREIGRKSWDIPQGYTVTSTLSTAPVGPALGSRYLVGANPVVWPNGMVSGNLTEWNGATWVAQTVQLGCRVFDVAARSVYVYAGGTNLDPVWSGSFWRAETQTLGSIIETGVSRVLTLEEVTGKEVTVFTYRGLMDPAVVITFPAVVNDGILRKVTVKPQAFSPLGCSVNVTGGGFIENPPNASLAINPGQARTLTMVGNVGIYAITGGYA